MFYDLVQSLVVNGFKVQNKKQSGGAVSVPAESNISGASLFFTMLAIFVIKVLLVMISYNIVVPKMMEKWGKDPEDFRPLSFVESVFIVILFNNLFSRF